MAIFVQPLTYTVINALGSTVAGTPGDMNNDEPGLVWRCTLTGGAVIDLGPNPVAYDTVTLVGTNLRDVDLIRVRTGTTTSGIGGAFSGANPGWIGSKPAGRSTTTVIRLGALRTERYLRIDFSGDQQVDANNNVTRTANPDGYFEIMRFAVGKAITCYNPDFGYQQTFEDRAVIATGPGYRTVEEYDVIPSAKFSLGWITDVSWQNDWYPMLLWAGARRALLFVPDESDPTEWATNAVFGCITSQANGKAESYNAWRCEATITSLMA